MPRSKFKWSASEFAFLVLATVVAGYILYVITNCSSDSKTVTSEQDDQISEKSVRILDSISLLLPDPIAEADPQDGKLNPPPEPISKAPIQAKEKIDAIPNNTEINNSGNLSVGQTGGTVNQTVIIEKPSIVLSDEDQKALIKNINLKYREVGNPGSTCVKLTHNRNNGKSSELLEVVFDFLTSEGFDVYESGNIQDSGGFPKYHYKVSRSRCMEIIISYQR